MSRYFQYLGRGRENLLMCTIISVGHKYGLLFLYHNNLFNKKCCYYSIFIQCTVLISQIPKPASLIETLPELYDRPHTKCTSLFWQHTSPKHPHLRPLPHLRGTTWFNAVIKGHASAITYLEYGPQTESAFPCSARVLPPSPTHCYTDDRIPSHKVSDNIKMRMTTILACNVVDIRVNEWQPIADCSMPASRPSPQLTSESGATTSSTEIGEERAWNRIIWKWREIHYLKAHVVSFRAHLRLERKMMWN